MRDIRNSISEKSSYLTKNNSIKLRPQAKYNYQLIWINYTMYNKGQEQEKLLKQQLQEVSKMVIIIDTG